MWHKLFGVVGAYRRVFGCDDGRVVLRELAVFTGFYGVSDMDVSSAELQRLEGRREVFDHIIRYCNLPPEQVRELHNMVLDEQSKTDIE